MRPRKFGDELWKKFAFEFIFGFNFPVSQSQGRELRKKDTWRRLAP